MLYVELLHAEVGAWKRDYATYTQANTVYTSVD